MVHSFLVKFTKIVEKYAQKCYYISTVGMTDKTKGEIIMVKVIMGVKGTGKTKQMVETINAAVDNENGHIVCIEKGSKLVYDIKSSVRLVEASDYPIGGYNCIISPFATTLWKPKRSSSGARSSVRQIRSTLPFPFPPMLPPQPTESRNSSNQVTIAARLRRAVLLS